MLRPRQRLLERPLGIHMRESDDHVAGAHRVSPFTVSILSSSRTTATNTHPDGSFSVEHRLAAHSAAVGGQLDLDDRDVAFAQRGEGSDIAHVASSVRSSG